MSEYHVARDWVNHNYSRKKTQFSLRNFLISNLGVKEYNPKFLIEGMLDSLHPNEAIRTGRYLEYCQAMLQFAKYSEMYEKGSENYVDFSMRKIFIVKRGSDLSCVAAKGEQGEILLHGQYSSDSVWKEVIALYAPDPQISSFKIKGLASILNKSSCSDQPRPQVLWEGYKDHFSSAELNLFVKFAVRCGVVNSLRVKQQRAVCGNKLWKQIYSYSARYSCYEINKDYYIEKLPELLSKRRLDISLKVWELVMNCPHSYWENYFQACYRPNKTTTLKTCPSTLLQDITEVAWLPNAKSEFFKPSEITLDELHPSFRALYNGDIGRLLHLGADVTKLVYTQRDFKQKQDECDRLKQENAELKRQLEELKPKPRPPKPTLPNLTRDGVTVDVMPSDDGMYGGSIHDLGMRSEFFETHFGNAAHIPKQIRQRARSYNSNKRVRDLVGEFYDGICQMCGTSITMHDGNKHFIALSIFTVDKNDPLYKSSFDIGWNTLCLCPNCAAKWKYCTIEEVDTTEQIAHAEVIPDDDERIPFKIIIGGKEVTIKFAPDHFVAFQTGYRKLLQNGEQ